MSRYHKILSLSFFDKKEWLYSEQYIRVQTSEAGAFMTTINMFSEFTANASRLEGENRNKTVI